MCVQIHSPLSHHIWIWKADLHQWAILSSGFQLGSVRRTRETVESLGTPSLKSHCEAAVNATKSQLPSDGPPSSPAFRSWDGNGSLLAPLLSSTFPCGFPPQGYPFVNSPFINLYSNYPNWVCHLFPARILINIIEYGKIGIFICW